MRVLAVRPTLAVGAALSLIASMLASCGGAAGTAGGGGQAANVLFAADIAHGSIGAFPDANPAAGSTMTGHVISGVSGLGNSLAYDSVHDRLYAPAAGTVLVYDHAAAITGDVAPSGSITPSGTSFTGPLTLFLDRGSDTLYVGGNTASGGAVLALSHASAAAGTVAPDRVMTIGLGLGVRFFTIDTVRSILYVVNSLVGVHAYDGVSTANGTIVAARNITLFAAGGLLAAGSGLAVDSARDRLYVADTIAGIHFVNSASAASGAATSGTVPLPNAQFVTFDAANDRLYVGAYDKAYILNGASTLADGTLPSGAVGALAPAGSSVAGFAFP